MRTKNWRTLRRLSGTTATAIAAAVTALTSQAAKTDEVIAPPVPMSIQVPAGNEAYLIRHAIGTQNYVCSPSTTSPSGFAWTLFTPQATVFNGADKQVMTHYFSPNPVENGTVRPTWQHSFDSSVVWAKPFPPSWDPAYVAPGAVAWVLLESRGSQEGPTGGDSLTVTTFIQRVNTSGGLAPSTGCSSWGQVGATKWIPYEADYVFFRAAQGNWQDCTRGTAKAERECPASRPARRLRGATDIRLRAAEEFRGHHARGIEERAVNQNRQT